MNKIISDLNSLQSRSNGFDQAIAINEQRYLLGLWRIQAGMPL